MCLEKVIYCERKLNFSSLQLLALRAGLLQVETDGGVVDTVPRSAVTLVAIARSTVLDVLLQDGIDPLSLAIERGEVVLWHGVARVSTLRLILPLLKSDVIEAFVGQLGLQRHIFRSQSQLLLSRCCSTSS